MPATTSTGIVAWENENADLTIWGTHDPAEAIPAIDVVYTLDHGFTRGSRDYRMAMPSPEQLAEARQLWGSPELLDQEGPWEEWQYGPEPRVGWVPYLFYIR